MTGRILAIGDIHGCNRLLKQLLDRIESTRSPTPLSSSAITSTAARKCEGSSTPSST